MHIFNEEIGQLKGASNCITVKDYIRLEKSNFLGRLIVKLDLYLQDKGWMDTEAQNRLVNQMTYNQIEKISLSFQMIIHSNPKIKKQSDLRLGCRLFQNQLNKRLNTAHFRLSDLKSLTLDEMIKDDKLKNHLFKFNASVDFPLSQYRGKPESLLRINPSSKTLVKTCFLKWLDKPVANKEISLTEIFKTDYIDEFNKTFKEKNKLLLDFLISQNLDNRKEQIFDVGNEKIAISVKKYAADSRYLVNFRVMNTMPEKKFEIELNRHGQAILPFRPGFLNKFSDDWKTRSLNIFDQLLLKNAFEYSPVTGVVDIHPLALERKPEAILKALCHDGNFHCPRIVRFLDDDLSVGKGFDAGGLSRQFISTLSQNLVKKLPSLSPDELADVGKFITACFSNRRIKLSGELPVEFFSLLQKTMSIDTGSDLKQQLSHLMNESMYKNDENLALIYHAWINDLDVDSELTDSYKNKFTLEEFLVDITYMVDEVTHPDAFDSTGKLKNEKARELMFECLSAKIVEAYHIGKGIRPNVKNYMLRIPANELSERIQGGAYSPQAVANLIRCESKNPVVKQKARWLKEFILAPGQSKDRILDLLECITGQRAFYPDTIVRVSTADDSNFCIVQTCSNLLMVPEKHVDIGTNEGVLCDNKQKFFNNLSLTLAQKGFDRM